MWTQTKRCDSRWLWVLCFSWTPTPVVRLAVTTSCSCMKLTASVCEMWHLSKRELVRTDNSPLFSIKTEGYSIFQVSSQDVNHSYRGFQLWRKEHDRHILFPIENKKFLKELIQPSFLTSFKKAIVHKAMALHKTTEFCAEWFSIYLNIASKFRTVLLFKNFVNSNET